MVRKHNFRFKMTAKLLGPISAGSISQVLWGLQKHTTGLKRITVEPLIPGLDLSGSRFIGRFLKIKNNLFPTAGRRQRIPLADGKAPCLQKTRIRSHASAGALLYYVLYK